MKKHTAFSDRWFNKSARPFQSLIAASLVCLSCSVLAAEAMNYRVVELKMPQRTQPGECPVGQDCPGSFILTVAPKAINDMGVIVGAATVDYVRPITETPNGRPVRPFMWESGTTTFLTPDTSKERCAATGVNNAKEVVGYCETDNKLQDGRFVGYAFYWRNGVFKKLSSSDWGVGEPRINARGEILESFLNGNIVTAAGAIVRALKIPFDRTGFRPQSINNSSVVVGNAISQRGLRRRAISWAAGDSPIELGCDADEDCQSEGRGINAFGIVVGLVEKGNLTRPGYWKEGKFIDLTMPQGATSGFAQRINDSGSIVGRLHGSMMNGPFFWSQSTGMRLIQETLLPESQQWKIQTLEDINNSNWIVGIGKNGSTTRPILLIPEAK